MLPGASHRLYFPNYFSLDDIWHLYSWILPLLHSAFRTGYFSIILPTIFGLSTLKILDAAAACRETHLSFSPACHQLNWRQRDNQRPEPAKNPCHYQIQLLQIQRHTDIPNTIVANAKTQQNTRTNSSVHSLKT